MASEDTSLKEKSSGSNSQVSEEGIKIPDFLDVTIDFIVNKVIYDNVLLENTKGTVRIVDETAILSNVTSKAFGGDLAFSGNVSTKQATPTFTMNLDLQEIDIDESFGKLALLKYIAPIAKALDGDINTTLNLSGQLNKNFTPNLKTLAGSAFAQILTAEVSTEKSPLLSKLGEQVKFLNMDKLSLRNVSTALDFNNGKIVVKPFNFDVEEIKITASGSHGLDKSIDYNVTMDVPAKYLGGEINKLLAKLDPGEAEKMTVVIPVTLKGTMIQPQINFNTKTAVNALTQKLIEKQKQDLEAKGINILEDLIRGDNKPKDSTATSTSTGKTTKDETTEIIKDIIGGIFGKKKTKKDSTEN